MYVLFGVVSPQPAFASSAYDGVVSVSSMTMNQGSCSGDIGSSYAGLLGDPSNWIDATNQASAHTAFQNVLAEGSGWAVIKREFKGSFSNVTPDWTPLVDGTSIIQLIYTNVINPQAPWQSVGVNFKYSSVYSYSLMGTDVPFWVVDFVWDSQQSPCTLKVWHANMQNGLDIPFANEDTDATMWSGLLHLRPVFINMPITYPSGYEGEVIPSGYSLPSPTYIAMGDSFSSGEGNDPFESGTDESGVNECHRSPDAYPEWLSQTPSLGMESYLSVACSGATTNDVLGVTETDNPTGVWNEPAQVDALSDETQVVTIRLIRV